MSKLSKKKLEDTAKQLTEEAEKRIEQAKSEEQKSVATQIYYQGAVFGIKELVEALLDSEKKDDKGSKDSKPASK